MIRAALVFFVLALIALLVGLTGLAGLSMEIAGMLIKVFLALALISGITHLIADNRSKKRLP